MITRVLALSVLASAFMVVGPAGCADVQASASSAGVIIEYGDRTDEFCVPIDGAVGAVEVLGATGAEVVLNDLGADQLTVCRVNGVGCDRDDCFCACRDTARGCTFWGLYQLGEDGAWRFAEVGIGQMRLRPGDVLGLRWDVQTSDGGAQPQAAQPEGVCTRVRAIAATRDAGGGPWGAIAIAGLIVVLLAAARARRRKADA